MSLVIYHCGERSKVFSSGSEDLRNEPLAACRARNSRRVHGPVSVYAQDQGQGTSNNWITDAPSDAERFQRIQKYLRGFDEAMHEVGERYEKIHEALEAENYDLALYHWDKIKLTIENGYMKRPARKANAEAILLDATWEKTKKAFASRDKEQAWQGFELARSACMAFHHAEKVGYINNQPLFNGHRAPGSEE